MKLNNVLVLGMFSIGAVLTAGCSNKPEPTKDMPVVNDENCKPENVASVDASVRTSFADACSRRGSFKQSTGKTY